MEWLPLFHDNASERRAITDNGEITQNYEVKIGRSQHTRVRIAPDEVLLYTYFIGEGVINRLIRCFGHWPLLSLACSILWNISFYYSPEAVRRIRSQCR